jgi:hypothetical protein
MRKKRDVATQRIFVGSQNSKKWNENCLQLFDNVTKSAQFTKYYAPLKTSDSSIDTTQPPHVVKVEFPRCCTTSKKLRFVCDLHV